MERLFALMGSNTQPLTASQASEAIYTQLTMADSLGPSLNQWTAGGLEALQESSDFVDLPATHDMHDMHDVCFSDQIHKAESIRFSSKFRTSTTAGFQPTELRTTGYVTNWMKVIHDGPVVLSDQAINWIWATEDVQLELIDANLSESLEQAEKFTKICDLNESLATEVKDVRATEPVRDGPSRESEAAQQEIEEFEDEPQIETCRSAKLERRLDKSKSELEITQQTDIAKLRLEKDMLLPEVNNLSSEKSSLESELGEFERVIQRLMTCQVHATPAPNTSQPPPTLFGIPGSSEPTSGPFRIRGSAEPTPGSSGSHGFFFKSSNFPTYEGNWILDDVTAFLFPLERHVKNAAQAIGWVGTICWREEAVLQLKGDAAVWAMYCVPMSTPIEWSTFSTELKPKFIASNALDLVTCKRE